MGEGVAGGGGRGEGGEETEERKRGKEKVYPGESEQEL